MSRPSLPWALSPASHHSLQHHSGRHPQDLHVPKPTAPLTQLLEAQEDFLTASLHPAPAPTPQGSGCPLPLTHL